MQKINYDLNNPIKKWWSGVDPRKTRVKWRLTALIHARLHACCVPTRTADLMHRCKRRGLIFDLWPVDHQMLCNSNYRKMRDLWKEGNSETHNSARCIRSLNWCRQTPSRGQPFVCNWPHLVLLETRISGGSEWAPFFSERVHSTFFVDREIKDQTWRMLRTPNMTALRSGNPSLGLKWKSVVDWRYYHDQLCWGLQ